ncbi:MAG TPA: hypothetical protein PKA95_14770 [Thermomicrobiales bacterium]|nr:hypothetical protein [Thermomicrobiales bacterium]
MDTILGFIIIGLLLVFMAISGSLVARWPVSTGMVYVGAGVLLGPPERRRPSVAGGS